MDLWARLIVGERFIEHGILPFKDFLSFTPTHPWYDHEYGSGTVFYLILKYFGSFGFILFQTIAMAGTVFFTIKIQQLQKNHYPKSLIAGSVFLVLFYGLNIHLVRCQLFSFFLFSVFLYILEKDRIHKTGLLWLIPVLTIIWNNLHGGIVAGLGLIGIYTVGSVLEKKEWKRYFYALVLSFISLIINPYGVVYLKFLFSAATMTRKYVVEWWNIFCPRHTINYTIYAVYPIFGLISKIYYSIKTKKYDYTKFLVLFATIFEGFLHVKLLSLAVIAVSALCYNEMFYFVNKYIKPVLYKLEKILYIVIIILGLTIPFYSPTVPRADFSKFPLKEVEFLRINNLQGNIVTSFGHGSFVSYKLYPNNLIYLDGRYEEVYNDKEFLALRDYELVEPNWKELINTYSPDILMPLKSVDVYDSLKKDKDWELIYEGSQCGIFINRNNVKYINKQFLQPDNNIMHYRNSLFNGYFGNKLRIK